jgi:phosphorylcholine metabolism protein LicD
MKDVLRWGSKKNDEFHDAKLDLLKELSGELGGAKWWLDYGTLLGCIREGDFIKADNDIDIGIHAKYVTSDLFDKINKNPKMEVDGKGDLDKFYITRVFLKDEEGKKVNVHGKPIWCDIYVYYPVENDYVMGTPTGKGSSVYYRIPKEHIDSLTTGSLRGKRFPIPSNSKKLMELVYGEDWETPNRGKTSHGNICSQFINKLKSYKYDRKNDKGIVEYTKTHLKEMEEEKNKLANDKSK